MDNKESTEKFHSYVRLALPLMSKHNVPVIPRNYTVWYQYVSGSNNKLSITIDKMSENKENFCAEKNEELYWKFCAEKNEKELKKLREDLQQILVVILTEVTQLNGQTGKYGSLVSNSAALLSEDVSLQKIRSIVNEILNETKAMDEFGKTILSKLEENTQELRALQKKFEQARTEASIDFLTGVPNRKAFDETLNMSVGKAISDNENLCLLMIDIDHFKRFNDDYGHIVGDEVLKFVAKKIKELVRGRDFLARFGGEEFVVILPKTPIQGAKTVAENIREFFAQAKLKARATSKKLGIITVSIGAACYRPGESLEKFINRSDQALYFAKNAGRNQVAVESDVEDAG